MKDPAKMRFPWTREEDELLRTLVKSNGPKNWSIISKSFPRRSEITCRLRWFNHLSSEVAFSQEEDETILRYHARGYNWSAISHHIFKGSRTNTEIKNHWDTTLKRKCRDDSGGDEEDEQEQPLKRMASDCDVSTQLCLSLLGSSSESDVSEQSSGSHVSDRSSVASSRSGDPLTCLSLSLPSQVNESIQLDLNMAIDNGGGYLTEKEEEEEEEEKRIRRWV